MIKIENFIDFNYKPIAFDISGLDKQDLKNRLEHDYVNHLWELDDAKYISIENCDLQGFGDISEIFFDHQKTDDFILAKLLRVGSAYGYTIDQSASCRAIDRLNGKGENNA